MTKKNMQILDGTFQTNREIVKRLEPLLISNAMAKITMTTIYGTITTELERHLIYVEKGQYRVDGTHLIFSIQDVITVEGTEILIWERSEYLEMLALDNDQKPAEIVETKSEKDTDIVSMDFIIAGNAEFTARAEAANVELTFKVVYNPDCYGKPYWVEAKHNGTFKKLGVIFADDGKVFRSYQKCELSANSFEFKCFARIWSRYVNGEQFPDGVTIRHTGRCGVCGRKLRKNQSIVNGIGPVCAKKIGLGK